MTVPLWPVALPQVPLHDGNSETALSNAIIFQPDRGPPIKRQGATLQHASVAASFNVSEAQKDLFYAFFEQDLKSGTLRFQMIDPYRNAPREYQIDGETYALTSLSPGLYRVSLNLRRVS